MKSQLSKFEKFEMSKDQKYSVKGGSSPCYFMWSTEYCWSEIAGTYVAQSPQSSRPTNWEGGSKKKGAQSNAEQK